MHKGGYNNIISRVTFDLQNYMSEQYKEIETKDKQIRKLKMLIREREHDVEKANHMLLVTEDTIDVSISLHYPPKVRHKNIITSDYNGDIRDKLHASGVDKTFKFNDGNDFKLFWRRYAKTCNYQKTL